MAMRTKLILEGMLLHRARNLLIQRAMLLASGHGYIMNIITPRQIQIFLKQRDPIDVTKYVVLPNCRNI